MKKQISRLVVLIVLAASIPLSYAEVVDYSDVESFDSNYVAIQYLSSDAVVVFQGYSDGTFRPDTGINRAELMKVLVESVYGVPSDEYANCYPDVGDDWYAKYVCYATAQGWVSGYPDGSFGPDNNVVKAEAVKMLLNVEGFAGEVTAEVSDIAYRDVSETAWYAPYVYLAQQYNFLEETGSYYEPGAEIDRAGVAEMLFRIYVVLYGSESYTEEMRDQMLEDVGLYDLVTEHEIVPADAVMGELTSTNSVGRSGEYYLPSGYNIGEKPLLVVYHGTGGDGLSMVNYFKDLADEYGFIIVAPDSRVSPDGEYTWQVGVSPGDFSEDYYHTTDCINEVEAMNGVTIDENYVMAAGFSGGASSAPYYATNNSMFTHFAILHGGVYTSGLGDNVVSGWLSTGEDDTLRTTSMMEEYEDELKYAGYTDLTYKTYSGGHELTDTELRDLIEWWLGE